MLNQHLHEKKRIHKLYSILRERTYFDMVVSDQGQTRKKDIKDLQFEPVLNVKQTKTHQDLHHFFKCSVDADLGILAMSCNSARDLRPTKCICVDMSTQETIFEEKVHSS